MTNLLTPATDDSSGPKLRLLICRTCNSIDALPAFDGPGEYDEVLHARVAQHQHPGPAPTRGHDMVLATVSEASWNDEGKRRGIVEKVSKEVVGLGQSSGLGPLADVRSTYQEDAMRCWRIAHARTSDCGDYMSSGMTILSDSVAERKDLGLDPKRRAKLKLCQFCVVHSLVQQKQRRAAGMYN